MELQNLNELRYIIKLETTRGGWDNNYYYVDSWPNPELRQRAENENNPIDVYDSIYYSSLVTDAKTYDDFTVARKEANLLFDMAPSWTSNIVAVSAKVFFKARLIG